MKYLYRFNENMNMAKSIVSKKLEAFDKLKELLSKNIGYIGKFTQYLMEENVPYKDLQDLYGKLIELKTKNINIDINIYTYEKLIDKIQDSENELNVNSVLTQFPSEQKKIVKELLNISYERSKVYNALLKISKKENLKAFISKISRYKTHNELKNAIQIFAKDATNDIESVKKYVNESNDSDIVLEKDNILIINVKSITDIKYLGSDTSWCILNNYSWDSYTKNRLQYVLYNYDKQDVDPKFKIGFTLNKDGSLYAAHDILDFNSKEYLLDILKTNNISIQDIIQKDIPNLGEIVLDRKTSITNWKLYVDNITNKEAEKTLINFLNIKRVGYNKNLNKIEYSKDLTSGETDIVGKLLKKLAINILGVEYLDETKNSILESQITNLDPRIKYLLKVRDIVMNTTYIPFNTEGKILQNFDKFEPIAFIKFVKDIPIRIFNSGWSGLQKLKFSTELLDKIYDIVTRNLNLIEKEETWDNDNDNDKNRFLKGYAFLSKLLNKKNDYNKYISLDHIAQYNQVFKEKIDLTKVKLYRINLHEKDFDWTDYIIKKDYPNLQMDIINASLLNDILNTLKGYNVTITINTTFTNLKTEVRKNHNKINNELLANLPIRSTKKEFTSEDGKHKIIIK